MKSGIHRLNKLHENSLVSDPKCQDTWTAKLVPYSNNSQIGNRHVLVEELNKAYNSVPSDIWLSVYRKTAGSFCRLNQLLVESS